MVALVRTPDEFADVLSGRHASSPPVLAVLRGGLNRPGVTGVRSDRFDEMRMELETLGDSAAAGFDDILAETRRALVALRDGKVGLAASHLAFIEDAAPLHSHRARRAAQLARVELLGGDAA